MGSNQSKQERLYISSYFYSVFDRSLFETFIAKLPLQQQAVKMRLLGEGSHMKVWQPDLNRELALSVSHSHFQDSPTEDLRLKTWVGNLKKLHTLELDLIPPFEIIRFQEQLALVSPLGSPKLENISKHSLTLDERLTALKEKLNKNSMVLRDSFQLLQWRGIPFICDLSDLERA